MPALELIKAKTITGLDQLDFDKKNWVRWSETALDAFTIAGTRDYVLGEVTKPASGDSDLPTWTKNDQLAQAGIRLNIAPMERDYIRDHCTITSAADIWNELKKRHRQKAATQTSLLDDLLGIRIERGADMVDAAAKVRNISTQVFEVAALDADKLALAVLLRALSPELKSIREKWEDDSNAKPGDIVQSLEKEKRRWEEETKQARTAEALANAARTQKSATTNNSKGLCGNCSGTHRTDECWGKGGAMEGRRDEVLERRAARRNKDAKQPDKPSPSSNNTKTPPKARFAMKDTSGKNKTAGAVITEVTSNDELEEIHSTYHTYYDSDASEYSMFADMRGVDTAAAVETEQGNSPGARPTVLVAKEYPPFAADSGATVHLSPVKADFHTLQTITPQKIWGIGGGPIEAKAKGDVHIRKDDGAIFILKDVLYVPEASMRLMSIGRVADTEHTAVFTSTELFIMDQNKNAIVATATHRDKKLYSLNGAIVPNPIPAPVATALAVISNLGTPPTPAQTSVLAATASASLEVWHRRLGHIGVSTIRKMAEQGLAEDGKNTSHSQEQNFKLRPRTRPHTSAWWNDDTEQSSNLRVPCAQHAMLLQISGIILWRRLHTLRKRRPTTYQRNRTPYEAWYGDKPNLSNLREIGCQAFALIQNKHNPKIFDRSIECKLIGYSHTSKAYICYDKLSRRVITSYHVEFIESHESVPRPLMPGRVVNQDREEKTRSTVEIESDDDDDDAKEEPIAEEQPVDDPPDLPRRSGRTPGETAAERNRRAVEESKAAGERIRANRQAKRQERAPNGNDAYCLIDDIVLKALLSDVSQINIECPNDPQSVAEAFASPQADEWRSAISDELKSIKDMNVYKLVPRTNVPKDRKIMLGKFVFKTKRDADGMVARYKARYVLLGHKMIYGKDFNKTTSPTARAESLRILFHLAAALDLELTQIDVKTAYLYGDIDETCWMEQPKGLEEPGKEDWVWELQKGLYGMPQGGRLWNKHMDARMKGIGFTQLSVEHCIYYRKRESGLVIAAVHVDDFTSAASSIKEELQFEEELRTEWQISRSDASFIVGWAIRRDRMKRTIFLSQKALIDRIIEEYGCKDANPVKTPLPPNTRLTKRDLPQSEEEGRRAAMQPYRQLVGVLMYLAISTRPDIMHAVSSLSRFNSGHGEAHWKAALHVVRYCRKNPKQNITD
ncbi:Retrovirus-related Pol polyprotein from transposon TNT 1-94 [Mycena sanguinolenta]|uniref:Retrovirus-related Pol polyprotein from transposon TNT 1-94 n=1 Tax=Mycena sanguinolenta TaxID=230812 RepID=A0A8H6XLV1_9AGAR|nr:Retrovirus-related Pol polyprotein from transposon TNT 1-94 [Mycena sanguinolenta]